MASRSDRALREALARGESFAGHGHSHGAVSPGPEDGRDGGAAAHDHESHDHGEGSEEGEATGGDAAPHAEDQRGVTETPERRRG